MTLFTDPDPSSLKYRKEQKRSKVQGARVVNGFKTTVEAAVRKKAGMSGKMPLLAHIPVRRYT